MSREVDRRAEAMWTEQEERTEQQQRQDEIRAQIQEERHPTRKPVHKFFVLISVVAALAGFNMGVGQLLGIFIQNVRPTQYVLRLYVVALCLLVILTEMEWPKFVRESRILGLWITRGLFYAFIGVLGLEENETADSRNEDSANFDVLQNYVKAVAWIMVLVGAFYFCMGVLCVQIYYNRLRRDYQERLGRASEIRRTSQNCGTSGENPV